MARLIGSLLLLTLLHAQADERRAEEKLSTIELTSFTCQQFRDGIHSENDANKMHALVMWLEGYMSAISGNTLLDWQNLEEYKKDLLAFCDKNPTLGLLEAARRAAVE